MIKKIFAITILAALLLTGCTSQKVDNTSMEAQEATTAANDMSMGTTEGNESMEAQETTTEADTMGMDATIEDVFSSIEKNDLAQLSSSINDSNINTQKDGLTPLMFANKLKNLEAVKLLVTSGADLEATGGEFVSSVLIQASEQGNIEIMKYLVENMANIEAIDVDGGTPLDCAAFEGKTEAIEYLVSVGADINHQGPVFSNTALILASMNGHEDAVKYLLSIGASTTLKNKGGKTASDVAKTSEIKELISSYKK